MATRYSRRLYGRTYYRRRYPYARRTTTSIARARGNQKAARQQKDICDVNLNIQHKCSTSFIHTVAGAQIFNCGVYALNIWDLLRKSEFYQSYASMYDQVKINSVKVKLTPISWNIQTANDPAIANEINYNVNTQYKAITIVTAWDRTGLSEEQIKIVTNNVKEVGDDENPNGVGIIGTNADDDGLYVIMTDDVATYSSAVTKSLSFGNSFSHTRMLYPSSMAEKSFYANTSDLDQWYTEYDISKGRFIGIERPGAVFGENMYDDENLNDQIIGYLKKTPACESNPAFLLEDSTIPFKPTLLIGVQSPYKESVVNALPVTTTIQNPITFNAEVDVGCTFRGLRKAKIVE